jgi:hypothetical protein
MISTLNATPMAQIMQVLGYSCYRHNGIGISRERRGQLVRVAKNRWRRSTAALQCYTPPSEKHNHLVNAWIQALHRRMTR